MGAKGSGRKKKIYIMSNFNTFKFVMFNQVPYTVRRNVVLTKYFCRDPYYKYALWQMIKTKGEYVHEHYYELRKQCEPEGSIKNVPETDLILGIVVSWTYDRKPMLENKEQRSRCYIISLSLYYLLGAMREAIENEAKEKGCKIYEFIPPKNIRLKRKEPSLIRTTGIAVKETSK